jgi:hypothetical protein
MFEQTIELALAAAMFVGSITGFYVFMRAAASWSRSPRTAITTGVVFAAVVALLVGGGWAEDKVRNCDTVRLEAQRNAPDLAREAYSECRAERLRTTRAHEFALLLLLGVVGGIGFNQSDYRRPMSLDRAAAIVQGTAEAMERSEQAPYSSKLFREAAARLGALPLDAEYRKHLENGAFLVAIDERR